MLKKGSHSILAVLHKEQFEIIASFTDDKL
jgi:hypothetical protein